MITVATLPCATAQEVFDQVATHLLTQGHKALGSNGVCVFLNDDGEKCAAGCLLAYEEFCELPEETKGGNWGDVANFFKVHEHTALIAQLQTVHDAHIPEAWESQLRNVANLNELNTGVLDVTRT